MINARKSLGQNFLVDARVARRIVDSVSPNNHDLVIEIGPGTGAITRLLTERSGFVVAVEIDARLAQELSRTSARENLWVIEADALNVNWAEVIDTAVRSWRKIHNERDSQPRLRVVANLPYYISTPIIEMLIRLPSRILDMTLMLQNEVVDRITSGPGGREYGYLSVLVQYYCAATKLFEVPPSAFKPAPKVQSAIVRLTTRDQPPVIVDDEKRFFALVRAAFAQRRKTIANNLKAATGVLGLSEPFMGALEAARIDPKRRAETLSIEEFGRLYAALFGA